MSYGTFLCNISVRAVHDKASTMLALSCTRHLSWGNMLRRQFPKTYRGKTVLWLWISLGSHACMTQHKENGTTLAG